MHTGALSWQQHTRDYQRRGVTSTDGGVLQYTLVLVGNLSLVTLQNVLNIRPCCNTGFLVCVSYEFSFQLSSFQLNINKTPLSDYSRL